MARLLRRATAILLRNGTDYLDLRGASGAYLGLRSIGHILFHGGGALLRHATTQRYFLLGH
jgi:hypothetical protein